MEVGVRDAPVEPAHHRRGYGKFRISRIESRVSRTLAPKSQLASLPNLRASDQIWQVSFAKRFSARACHEVILGCGIPFERLVAGRLPTS